MMQSSRRPSDTFRLIFRNANVVLVLIASGKLLLHLLTANGYGYFCDEMYTIAMGRHPAFGYVDIPPLVPWLSALSGSILGYSQFALHVLPAIAGAATVFVAGLIARRLGGGVFAQALTALFVALGLVWLVANSIFAYDGFDQLVTAVFFYVILGILQKEKPSMRQWLAFGIVAGLALMTKGSMLFYGFTFLIGLLLSKRRAYFAQGGLWIGGAIAFAIFTPYLVWQGLHGWPVLEYWSAYARFKTYHANPIEFLLMQIVTQNPITLPVWAAGLFFFFNRSNRNYRTVGWMAIVLFVICVALAVKFYMMSACFFPLLAAGAVQLERFTEKVSRKWIRPAYTGVFAAVALAFVPIALPILPVERLVGYIKGAEVIMGVVKTENYRTVELPQHLADRFGWENLVETVASVYGGLSPEEQAECVIYCGDNYSSAAAIDLLGPRYGLPQAICGHLSYYFWGPGERSGKVVVALHDSLEGLEKSFEDVKTAATIVSPYTMSYNTNLPVYICRKPRFASLAEVWPSAKAFR